MAHSTRYFASVQRVDSTAFTMIRDPLWNNIRLEPLATRLMDTGVMQRLRYVRQPGLAFLVYPGGPTRGSSTRSAPITLGLLQEHEPVPADAAAVARMTALLHDVGHYPFSHALEEIGALARPVRDDPAGVHGALNRWPARAERQGHDELYGAVLGGHYLIACGVPGHAPSGMWIKFVVAAAPTPSYQM